MKSYLNRKNSVAQNTVDCFKNYGLPTIKHAVHLTLERIYESSCELFNKKFLEISHLTKSTA